MEGRSKTLEELNKKYGFKEVTVENGKITLNPVFKKYLNKTWEVHNVYALLNAGEISTDKARELTAAIIESAYDIKAGDTVRAFDGKSWKEDVGDNSQFYKEAEVIEVRIHTSMFGGHKDLVADIKWKHNGEISHGHFINGLTKINDKGSH